MSTSQYFFHTLIPDIMFLNLNSKSKIVDANGKLDLYYKEYNDFLFDLPNKKALSFSTEELKQTHLKHLNQECFSKMAKLTSKYISAINTRVNTIKPLLSALKDATTNLELTKYISQVNSLSNSKLSNTSFSALESFKDFNQRLDTIHASLLTISDIKSILIDNVKSKNNVLGNITSSIINNLKANKSFRYIDEFYSSNIACESILPYARPTAVHDYIKDSSLLDAGYTAPNLLQTYNKICNLNNSLNDYFTKNYFSISYFDQNDSNFEKIVKSLKSEYFSKDDLPIEQTLPIRFMRLTSTINILTDTLLPTLYKDTKYLIELFSRVNSLESINTSSESFEYPDIKSKLDDYSELYDIDKTHLNNNYLRYLQSITKRLHNRLFTLNKDFNENIPQKLYHVKNKDTLVYPISIDEYNQRLYAYSNIFNEVASTIYSLESNINDKSLSSLSDNDLSSLNTLLSSISNLSKSKLYTTVKSDIFDTTISTSYLDTLVNESKVSLEAMGYNQDNINELKINDFRDSLSNCYKAVDVFLDTIKNSTYVKDVNSKIKFANLSKLLTLTTNLVIQSRFEYDFLNSISD